MIVLSHALCCHASIKINDRTVTLAIVSNLTDLLFVGDPLIQQDVVRRDHIQEGFHRSLPEAHFLDATQFLWIYVLDVTNEVRCKKN